MSGPDPRTPISAEDQLAEEIRVIKARLDELSIPTGTQAYQAVSKLQTAVERLEETVEALPISRVGQEVTEDWQPAGWATVASLTIDPPTEKTDFTAHSIATLNLRAVIGPSDYPEIRARVKINGVVGTEVGLQAFFANVGGSLAWTFAGAAQQVVASSGPAIAEVQVWLGWITGGGSYVWDTTAQLVMNSTFTGSS